MQSEGCNRCRDRAGLDWLTDNNSILFSPLTRQMKEKYWRASFLISILSPNFDREWNGRKSFSTFNIFSMKNIKQTKFNMVF